MWDNQHLKSLLEMSKQQSEKINLDVEVFNETFKGVIDGAPIEQKGALEKLQSTINKATTLAKEGKTTEAMKIINNLKK